MPLFYDITLNNGHVYILGVIDTKAVIDWQCLVTKSSQRNYLKEWRLHTYVWTMMVKITKCIKYLREKKFIYRTWIIYYNMNTSQNSVEIPFRCTKRIHQRSYDTLLLGLINAIISGKLYSLIRPLLGNRMPTLHVFQSRRRFHSY